MYRLVSVSFLAETSHFERVAASKVSPELLEGNGYEGRQTSKRELFVKVFSMSRDFEGAHIDFKMAASM